MSISAASPLEVAGPVSRSRL